MKTFTRKQFQGFQKEVTFDKEFIYISPTPLRTIKGGLRVVMKENRVAITDVIAGKAKYETPKLGLEVLNVTIN
jgi:hypothetical protein